MVQAYLRGFLEPDYAQGIRSKARERMILTALSMENVGNATERAVLAELTMVSPHIDIQKSKGYIRSTNQRLRYAAEKKQYSLRTMREMFRTAEEAVQNMVAMYQQAKQSGFLDDFKKQVDSILKKHRLNNAI